MTCSGACLRAFPSDEAGRERVQAALVLRTDGDWHHFQDMVRLVERDWRDALVAADLADEDWNDRLTAALG